MARLILHAGFHRTGVAAIRTLLSENKTLLAPSTRFFLRKDLTPICEAARAYSSKRDPADLVAFTHALADFFQGLEPAEDHDIIISAADLCGLLPGRRAPHTYEAAPILMRALVLTLTKELATPPEVIFFFSLREPTSWLQSCHTQHLRTSRMTLSFEDYALRFRDSANLSRIVDKVRVAVAPHAVHVDWFENFSVAPLGPLDPIADLLGWSQELRDQLSVQMPAEGSLPAELTEEFLRLNQSDLEDDALRQAKTAAHKQWRKTRRTSATNESET